MRRAWLQASLCLAAAFPAWSAEVPIESVRSAIEASDLLGARILVRRLEKQPIPPNQWYAVRALIARHPELGVDLILRGDRVHAAKIALDSKTDLTAGLEKADQLLAARQFNPAFESYQKAAKVLKAVMDRSAAERASAQHLYPYVLHGMARALFGAKRFGDASTVYQWIPKTYPRFRQTLFERMWSAFKSGRVDLALGAIASQRSKYFPAHLEPETYLVQLYLYKSLCRDADIDALIQEISDFKWRLEKGAFTFKEWADSSLETRTLSRLSSAPPAARVSAVGAAARESEQAAIRDLLTRMFEAAKPKLLSDLQLVEAYSNLAVTPGMDTGLKPIERLPSREALFRANLEIWPADSNEEWIDEIGQHRFIGATLCKAAK